MRLKKAGERGSKARKHEGRLVRRQNNTASILEQENQEVIDTAPDATEADRPTAKAAPLTFNPFSNL
jgi:hypothetical protein